MGWGDIFHTLDNVGQMIGNTAKDVAVAEFVSVPGLAWDMTSPIFSDKNFDAGRALGTFASRAFKPITDTSSLTGSVISPVMHESEKVYSNAISEPLSTVITMLGHAEKDPLSNAGDLFDSGKWGEAYKIAQHRSIGQAVVAATDSRLPGIGIFNPFGSLGFDQQDPLDPKAYKNIHAEHPFLSSLASGATDAAVRFRLDPLIVAGKAAAAIRVNQVAHPISAADRAYGIAKAQETQDSKVLRIPGLPEIGKQGLKTRTEAIVGGIKDDKFTPGFAQKLGPGQLYHAIPEFKAHPQGRQLAQLLYDAGHSGDNVAAQINAGKFIMAAAQGDSSAINGLVAMRDKMASLTTRVEDAKDLEHFYAKGDDMAVRSLSHAIDELKNIDARATLNLEIAGLQDEVVKTFAEHGISPPTLAWGGDVNAVANAESQVSHLKDLGDYLNHNATQLKRLDDVAGTLDYSPRVTKGGLRAVGKSEGKGLLRSGEAATGRPLLDRALNAALSRPLVTIYQSSPTAMPIRIVRTLTAKTLQGPTVLKDAMGAIRPEGQINLNDIPGMSKEIDAMLRKAYATPEERGDFASAIARSTDTMERTRLVAKVEAAIPQSLARHFKINNAEDFITAQTRRAMVKKESLDVARNGRAYSATQVEPDSLSTAQKAASAENSKIVWRIDHLADDGIPTAMPVLDGAQDASMMSTIDVNAMHDTFRRYAWLYRAANSAYIQEAEDTALMAQRAQQGLHALDHGLERLYLGKDKLMPLLDEINRAWKFAQLFRLGYLQRVIMDDHFRIAAKFGAETLRVGMMEGTANFWHNDFVSPHWNAAQKKTLISEKLMLEDQRGTDEMYAYNQRAWDQLDHIGKKLGTVRSAARRKELENQRDVLLDFHPTNLKEKNDRLAEVTEALKTGSFRKGKGRMGQDNRRLGDTGFEVDGVTGAPVYVEGAYEGPYGKTYRGLVQSQGSWAQYGASVESQIHGNLARAGSFRTYLPTDEKHLHAWADVLNNQLRRSELVKMVWAGKSEEEIVHFLRTTPEGQAMAKRMPWQGGNPEQWAHHVTRMGLDYAPTAEFRAEMLKGETTADLLSRRFPTMEERPEVHGGMVDANIGMGGFSHALNSTMNRFYSMVGNRNDMYSRHPLFVVTYRQEAKRLANVYREAARKDGREFTSEEINGIEKKAREHARTQVDRTLFEMGSSTELQHWLRIVSPFFGAWREGLDRWWNIIARDPSAIRKFQMGFDIPRRLGLVVDDKGNPVAPGDAIADNHYIMIQMPPAWSKNPKTAWKTDFKVSESGFNLIFQGGGLFNPGFGPLVQIPANHLAVENPEYAKQFEAILPLGTQTKLFGPIIPSQVNSTWTYASAKFFNHHSTQYKQYNAMILRDMAVEFEQAHGRAPSDIEQNKMIEESQNRTLGMAFMKAFAGFTSPASLQIESKFTPQLQAYRRLEDYGLQNNKPFFWATNKFVEQYGEAFFPLIGSAALNNGGLSSTDATVAYIKKNRHLFNETDPSTYRMIVGGAGDGAYSQAARNYFYTHEMRPGSSEPFVSLSDPRDALAASAVNQGWFDYDNMLAKLDAGANAQGLASYLDSPELMAQKKAAIATMGKQNTAWFQDYSTHNDAAYDSKIASMKVIASDPKLNADPGRHDIKVLQDYLYLHDQYTAMLKTMGQYGGSTSPDAIANQPLMQQYAQAVSNLKESNIWFSRYMFNGTIEFDPMLRSVA